jgi:hypothetical protein
MSLLEMLSKAQMLSFCQDAVRELELPFLLGSVKLVFGTLVKERGYVNKSVSDSTSWHVAAGTYIVREDHGCGSIVHRAILNRIMWVS